VEVEVTSWILSAGAPVTGFGRRPFLVRHRLSGHPLFDLPRLVDLAGRLPADHVEWNAGDLPIGQDPARTPANGLSPAETIRRIADHGSWLVLKYVEREPAYRALLDDCLDEVARVSEPLEPGMCLRHGFIFVSSPRAVTPYHIDPEQNFLLQLRGEKRMWVWDANDRVALPERELERFMTGGHRNLPWHEGLRRRARSFTLRPGDGVHVPVTAPHWVENGAEPSVSFSITFRTRATELREKAVKVKAWLRRFARTCHILPA
jgi:quercetin dioxygenase-like cupin family protein